MDESWRVAIGPLAPRRPSTTDHPRHRLPPDPLEPDDFRDVFGGPPRTVLLRRFSSEMLLPRAGSFYDEVFRPPQLLHGGGGGGRSLPGFRIPPAAAGDAGRGGGAGLVRTEEGFYDDIFGSDGGDRRSRSRSKSKSGSSSERSPPLRAAAEDPVLSFFASKLRPISIPSRRQDSSPPSTFSMEEQSRQRNSAMPPPCFMNLQHNNHDGSSNGSSCLTRQRSHVNNNYFSCCFSPPETLSIDPSFHGSIKKRGGDNSGIDSPSSVISSFFLDPVASKAVSCASWQRAELQPEKVMLELEVEEGEEAESSYIIEIDSNGAEEVRDAAAVDEVIAWAKEKFWNQMPKENATTEEKNENKEKAERNECSFTQTDEGLQMLKEHHLSQLRNEYGDGLVTMGANKDHRDCEGKKETQQAAEDVKIPPPPTP